MVNKDEAKVIIYNNVHVHLLAFNGTGELSHVRT